MYRVRYQLPDSRWSFWAIAKSRTDAKKLGAKHSATYEIESYVSEYSAMMGRIGAIKTAKKSAASAANGKKGGRPKSPLSKRGRKMLAMRAAAPFASYDSKISDTIVSDIDYLDDIV